MERLKIDLFTCGGCDGVKENEYGYKADSHTDYGYLCEDCFNGGVMSKGMFIPKVFVEHATAKKKASHGCITSWQVSIPKEKVEDRAWLFYTYGVAKVGDLYVSTGKCGTWQMSKAVDELQKLGYTPTANFTKRQNGKSYHLDNAKPETVIELVRNVSAIGYLSDKAIKKYGLTTR